MRLSRTHDMSAGDDVTVSRLDMDVHCGTHLEAPMHYLANGHGLDTFDIGLFVGPAYVAWLPDAASISEDRLAEAGIPSGTERLLLRTMNSSPLRRRTRGFQTDYAALSPSGANWIADHAIRLVGIDYLSVQRFSDEPDTHRILMEAGVAILEGLDLGEASPGRYHLIALPLRLAGAEAAPVRAVLEAIE